MKILIIDNYDSFTYNLFQYVGELMNEAGSEFNLDVIRNDAITLSEIQERKYDRVIISPGPGNPADAKYFGVCADVLTKLGQHTPVLGVCLGMQGMAHYFGGRVVRAQLPMHGKTSAILHDGKGIFKGLPQHIEVMRYHSLVADPAVLPKELEVTATAIPVNSQTVETEIREVPFHNKKMESLNPEMLRRKPVKQPLEIMGLRHKKFPIEGVQFHPESFATEGGKRMLANFLFTYKNG